MSDTEEHPPGLAPAEENQPETETSEKVEDVSATAAHSELEPAEAPATAEAVEAPATEETTAPASTADSSATEAAPEALAASETTVENGTEAAQPLEAQAYGDAATGYAGTVAQQQPYGYGAATGDMSQQMMQKPVEEENARLHISNLPFRVRDPELRAMFEPFGAIIDAEIICNERGSKGFGFVSFYAHESAKAAKEALCHTQIDGRRVEVNWATRRTGPPRRHNPEQNAWGMGAMGGYGMPAAYGYGMPGAYDPATAAAWAQYYQQQALQQQGWGAYYGAQAAGGAAAPATAGADPYAAYYAQYYQQQAATGAAGGAAGSGTAPAATSDASATSGGGGTSGNDLKSASAASATQRYAPY